MSFQAPFFLLGLLVVPLALAALALARRRPRALRRALPGAADARGRRCRAPRAGAGSCRPRCSAWRSAGLALALARPETTVAVPVERASVMLVTDTSGSMQATDVAPSRLAAAQAAAERFLTRVPDALQVGLVAYADGPHTVVAPTRDRAEVRGARSPGSRPRAARPRATRSTALCGAGRPRQGQAARPPIVLLSDGANQAGAIPPRWPAPRGRRACRSTPSRSARRTARSPAPDGAPLPVPPDPAALAEVAQISGGRAFAAEDADALDEVYERLGSRIGTRKEKREISAGFAAAGLLLLAGALGTSLRWRGRLP